MQCSKSTSSYAISFIGGEEIFLLLFYSLFALHDSQQTATESE